MRWISLLSLLNALNRAFPTRRYKLPGRYCRQTHRTSGLQGWFLLENGAWQMKWLCRANTALDSRGEYDGFSSVLVYLSPVIPFRRRAVITQEDTGPGGLRGSALTLARLRTPGDDTEKSVRSRHHDGSSRAETCLCNYLSAYFEHSTNSSELQFWKSGDKEAGETYRINLPFNRLWRRSHLVKAEGLPVLPQVRGTLFHPGAST